MDQRIIQLYDDFTHGHLDRRLFLERLAKLVGSTAAALVLLPQLESDYAGAQTVPETDARIGTEEVTYPGSTGTVTGYLARPAGAAKAPGVIVIHENRGVQPHIRDVARRAALAGYVTLAPDLMSAVGGTPASEDEARTRFARVELPVALADALKSIEYLRARPDATGKVGVVGFCWGGSLVGEIAAAGADVQAGVVFYGIAPPLDKVSAIKAPLLLHYAGLDDRVNATVPPFEDALKKAGKTYTLHVYEGTKHAFHNDTAGARYDPAAATLAWSRTLEFFARTLR
ncbi:MAG TPA: dienelactone hydrolase family protein [Methylomirabilota bacterium]|nr:dienelactone hydrolase family protein [Methylomirabilota bacterium]